jgi:hypothetical protein
MGLQTDRIHKSLSQFSLIYDEMQLFIISDLSMPLIVQLRDIVIILYPQYVEPIWREDAPFF